ncbi:hypothetical protein EVAR_3550_1 [Eumeta japonica]|uniref:Uncharacterized protein n=1 Tax=Eumeta variegata TaxID=151549 RepID=A0A4C1SY39_EUMVA|nr:hypothetical protein EVAR_3550_1 [Eumeta japonica]
MCDGRLGKVNLQICHQFGAHKVPEVRNMNKYEFFARASSTRRGSVYRITFKYVKQFEFEKRSELKCPLSSSRSSGGGRATASYACAPL